MSIDRRRAPFLLECPGLRARASQEDSQDVSQRPRRKVFGARCSAGLVGLSLAVGLALTVPAQAQPDLYIKDTPADMGNEPNLDTGAMWISEDIWVRRHPDPSYQATPYPSVSPAWTPLPHQNPEYRDPIYSVPNYIYVRVRNRGTSPSLGTERLTLNWAKASTGLGWNAQWFEYMDNFCGPDALYGDEVTKPRRNAASVSLAERERYIDAVEALATDPSFEFVDGVSYWHKQDQIHESPIGSHGNPVFLPWHREFINRLEVLLQKENPLIKLLYWDWTTDPENSMGVNLFSPTFMGASGRGVGPISIISPLTPPAIVRNLSPSLVPPAGSDAALLAEPDYNAFWITNEFPYHNASHGYIGGSMGAPSTAAQDPFFFLLHTNADRLWAQWQRDPSSLSRLEGGTAYDGHSSNVNITSPMAPWSGGLGIEPWTASGGHVVIKNAKHQSVVSPPAYDTAPVVVPVLAPGEEVILEIPWYPPNPADYSCPFFGPDDFDHFCLLARVETGPEPTFGMTTPEGTSVYANTRQNNNIAWKNITVIDDFEGPAGIVGFFVRNIFDTAVVTRLGFTEVRGGGTYLDTGGIYVELGPELYGLWQDGGAVGHGVRTAQGREYTVEILAADAYLDNLTLQAGAAYPLRLRFELDKTYQAQAGVVPKWDVVQIGGPGDAEEVVGGNRYELDFSRLKLIPAGAEWRFWDRGAAPGGDWTAVAYDDGTWRSARADLGFGDAPATTLDGGPDGDRHMVTYFRHHFEIDDPSFYRGLRLRLRRDDGAVVYLNGVEIHRVHMPAGVPSPTTAANHDVEGLEETQYFPVSVSEHLSLLQAGTNVVAVEVHQADPSSDDLSFDLELCANDIVDGTPPDLRFETPEPGAVVEGGQILRIEVAAADPDPQGRIVSVQLQVNGKSLATADTAPYTFSWTPTSLGVHRLRAVATDDEGRRSNADLTLRVMEDAPPTATLIEPVDGTMQASTSTFKVSAEAQDVADGRVVRVEFYALDMREAFTKPATKVGEATAPPYSIDLQIDQPGHHMIWATAVDDGGGTGQSSIAHIHIMDASRLFIDGFESGNTTAWSTTLGAPNP